MQRWSTLKRNSKSRWQVYEKMAPWAMKALWRDKFACAKCNSINNIVVHHLDESRKNGYYSMNNDLSNLITLCRPCHSRIHGFTNDRQDVLEMRDMGMTFQAIATKLKISRQRAYQIYELGKKKLAY